MKNRAFLYFVLLCCACNIVKAIDYIDRENRVKDLLSLSLEELMEIKISTANKIAEKIGEIPASIILITRQEIQRYGYTTLDEILEHTSGFYRINSYSLGGSSYGVRGYLSTSAANRNIIILVNGVNQVSDHNSTYYITSSPVPVEAIDRIEIVRGPQSTIYGSGAFFGVINIITNEVNQKEGSESYVSLLSGSRHTRRAFGRTSYAYDQGKVVVNVGNYQDDGFDVPYSRLESKSKGMEANLTTDGRTELAQKYFGLSGNYKNISFDMTYSTLNEEGLIPLPTVRSGTVKKIESTRLRLGYETELSKQLSLNSKLTYIHNRTHVDFDSISANDPWAIENDGSTAYEGEITLQWKMPKHLDIVSGLYYRYVPKVSNFLDVPSYSNTPTLQKSTQRLQSGDAIVNRALFSQLNYYPDKQWKWVMGLRLEQALGYGIFAEYGKNPAQYKSFSPYFDAQKLAVIPRLAAIYTLDEKNIFKWMYGKAINSPSFLQNTSRLTDELPKLEAERMETYEFNYITYLSPRYMLSANIFHNRLQNLFERVLAITPSGQYINYIGNSGKWRTNGLELSLHAQPTDHLKLELGATYQQTKDLNRPTIETAYSPHLLGQFKGIYEFNKQLSLGLTAYYVSKMEIFFDPTLKNPDGTFGRRMNGTPSKNYWVAGANLRYQNWLSKGTFLNLRVTNLFNKEITYPTYTGNTWIDRGSLGEQRTFMFSLGYEF